MKQFFKHNIKPRLGMIVLLLLLCSGRMYAQTSAAYIDSSFTVRSGDTLRWYGNVTLAAGAKIYLEDGAKVYFYGDTLTVKKGAKIYGTASSWSSFTAGLGTGMVTFQKPNPYDNSTNQQVLIGGYGGGTQAADSTNTFVGLEINNAKGVKLTGSGTRIGSNLTFTNGHIYVDTLNLVMSKVATITNADNLKFVVTDSSGFVVREGLGNTAFAFPVGSSDVPGDYLPATLTNSGQVDIYRVRARASLLPVPASNAAAYLTRSWQIIEDTVGGSKVSLTLQHNLTSNQGNSFVDGTAQIVSSPATVNWQVASAGATSNVLGTVAGSSARTLTAITDFSTNINFTKGPAASGLIVSAKVLLEGAMTGTTMTTYLNTSGFVPKTQPYNTAPYNYAGTESVTSIPTGVTDWVLVELRDKTTPTTVVATRAAFVKSDGSVVDMDGTSAVNFPTATADNYYIVIRHRNHLSVESAAPVSLPNTVGTQYDFTTGLAKAMDNGTGNSMVQVAGLWTMWAGDYNHDEIIDGLDNSSITSDYNQGLFDGYFTGDLNFDGFVDGLDVSLESSVYQIGLNSPLF